MRITRLDPADDGAVRACHEVWLAAQAADDPDGAPWSLPVFRFWLTRGWDCDPCEVWIATDEGGQGAPGAAGALGWYRLELPDLDNRDRTRTGIVVHPAVRRHGTGSAMLRHAVERARANARSVLRGFAQLGSAGEAFARQAGATPGLVDARRVLDLRTAPAGRFARLRSSAAEAAAGYTLVSWTGPTPDDYLGGVASVQRAMDDAPHDAGREDGVWDAQRVRDRIDAAVRDGIMRGYSVAAIADAGGEMAGLTQVYVDPEYPGWGFQGITAVTRPHRGHRLGMLTKATMMERLAEAEPKLQRIETGNAASNTHMIAINEELGFTASGRANVSYTLPVASVR